MCEKFSFLHICKECQNTFLTPELYKTKLSNGVDVISFYRYKDIKELLHTKHTDLGYYIFHILAKNSILKFANEFSIDFNAVSIAVDDNPNFNYSHSAILNSYLKTKNIKPLYSKLRAKNRVSYSKKSKEFRENNPRNFELKNFKEQNVILVDDIITTGSTLTQATNLLKQYNKDVLFCLTLAKVF